MKNVSKAYEKIFGNVNTEATARDPNITMRKGKTARDKAKGHIPYQKNRRMPETAPKGKGK